MKVGDDNMTHITMADAIDLIEAAIIEARTRRLSPLAIIST